VIVLLSTALFPLRWACIYWSIPGLLGAQSFAGTICGTMNFCSNLWAGAIVPIIVGFILEATGSYFFALMFFGAAALGYLICSLSIDFNRPMHAEQSADAAPTEASVA
jgi:ACS family D-galactonate transporter-like MFS transporter